MFYHALPKAGLIRRTGRWALRKIRLTRVPAPNGDIDRLNAWQEGFCAWNAERLGLSLEESERRYRASWQSVRGGHGGAAFRRFCQMQMNVFSVIADDSPAECHDAYLLHGWLFLLRQISQPVPVWKETHPILEEMAGRRAPVILDYGCGVAQSSISLALALRADGARPHILLADLPTVGLEFTAWLCRRLGLSAETFACRPEKPIPVFPKADIVVAREIFEHLHDPLSAMDMLDDTLRPGGFLVTNVDDHEREFMHVSPDLDPLRNRLAVLGYTELDQHVLFRKPIASSVLLYNRAAVA